MNQERLFDDLDREEVVFLRKIAFKLDEFETHRDKRHLDWAMTYMREWRKKYGKKAVLQEAKTLVSNGTSGKVG